MPQRIPRLAAPCEQVITRRLNDALRRSGSFLTFVGSFSGHGTSDFYFVIFSRVAVERPGMGRKAMSIEFGILNFGVLLIAAYKASEPGRGNLRNSVVLALGAYGCLMWGIVNFVLSNWPQLRAFF